MGRVVLLVLVFFILCCAVAQGSALFYSEVPPGPVKAGKAVVFSVRIINTGIESWESGEFFVFVKIYDSSRQYLTATEKLRQMLEIEPGESLPVKIEFELPLDYRGVYYYTINLEIEDKEVLESRYFRFEVEAFVEELEEKPRYTGSLRVGYQASSTSIPSSNFSLSLLDRIDIDKYRTVSISGKDFGLSSAQINSFVISNVFLTGNGEHKVELRAGDISSALSSLTLNKMSGLRIGATHEKIRLAGLVGVSRDDSSGEQNAEPNVHGIKISSDVTDDLSVGVNFLGKMEGQDAETISEATSDPNSALSVEVACNLAPNLSILSEYAWNIPYGGDSPKVAQDSNAFHVEGSFDSEKVYIDGSYKKVKRNFSVPGNEDLKKDYSEHGIFVDYFIFPYVTAGLYYYAHMSHPSDENRKLLTTTESVDVSFYPPGLPLLTLTYDIDKMQGVYGNSAGFPINDVTYTLHGAFSHHFGNTRLSVGYFSSHYQDRTESALEDDFSLITYRISSKWWDRLSISATQQMEQKQTDEDEEQRFPAFSLAMTYAVIPQKLTFSPSWKIERKGGEEQDDQTTTRAILRYVLSSSNILECSYSLKNYGSFTNLDTLVSGEAKMTLRWRFNLGKNHNLDLTGIFTASKDFIQTKAANTSSINLTYTHSF